MNTSELFDKAAAETERLQRELDITNADHIALWLETNKDDSSLGWLACRIIEAHEQSLSTLRQRIEALEAENARLREALEGVLTFADQSNVNEYARCPECSDIEVVAKAALQGGA